MIALDTNVLVYAHREDATWHDAARRRIAELAEGTGQWAVPGPCLYEFLAIVTHPRIWSPPTPLEAALEQVAAWSESPGLVLLPESPGSWDRLAALCRDARVSGPLVHDARIAALCIHHGVDELWTADRDFSRFPALKTRNPLVG